MAGVLWDVESPTKWVPPECVGHQCVLFSQLFPGLPEEMCRQAAKEFPERTGGTYCGWTKLVRTILKPWATIVCW